MSKKWVMTFSDCYLAFTIAKAVKKYLVSLSLEGKLSSNLQDLNIDFLCHTVLKAIAQTQETELERKMPNKTHTINIT